MKKLLFVLLVLSVFAVNAQVPSYVPTNGLVAYYPFNGNANDASGNGNNGTVNGATLTSDRIGNTNGAYFFSGSGCNTRIDCVVNTSSITQSNEYTVSLWVKKMGDGCMIHPRILEFLDQNNLGSLQINWDVSGTNNLMIETTNNSSQYLSAIYQNSNWLNQWHHLVISCSSLSLKIYDNGVLISSTPFSGLPKLASNVSFGRMNHPAYNTFNGSLDDIAIYNRALSQSEIISLYNSNSCIANITNNDTSICRGQSVTLNVAGSNNNSNFSLITSGDCFSALKMDSLNYFITTRTSVLKSNNINGNWSQTNWPLGIVRSNTSIVGAIEKQGSRFFVASLDNGNYFSNNLGSSYQGTGLTGFGCASPVIKTLSNGDCLMSMGGFQRGIYKIQPTSNTWVSKISLNPDFSDLAVDNIGNVYSPAYSPNHPGGLYRSIDNGETWNSIWSTSYYDNPQVVKIYNDTIFAITVNGKLYKSQRNSINFSLISNNNGIIGFPSDFFIDSDGVFYVTVSINSDASATSLAGLFVSRNRGVTWTRYQVIGASNYYKINKIDGKILVGTNTGMYEFIKNTPTYLWSTGATTPSISVSPTVTTKYYCTVSDGVNTCKDSVTVTVSTIPTNLIPTDTIKVCGTSTTISATTGLASYTWSNGANTASTTVTSSGWYKCTATNGACVAIDSVYVSLFNPKITQNDTTVCAGTALTLTVNNNTALTSSLPANLRNGLVGYWPFNGNANDESGNGNNGTVNGATLTSDRFGQLNSSYATNNNQYIKTQSVLQNISNNFSISLWAYPQSTDVPLIESISSQAGFGLQPIIHPSHGSNWGNESLNAGVGISVGINQISISEHTHLFISAPLVYSTQSNLSNWHHIVLVYNSHSPTLYLDGVLVRTGLISQIQNIRPSSGFDNRYPNSGFGNSFTPNGTPMGRYKGSFDDISIFNRALTQSEITQLYSGASSYLWSTTATTQSINVNPTATTSYIATVSNGINTCKDTVKITVANITSLAPTTIFGAVDVCASIGADTASVPVNYKINKITNAASYVWTVPAGATLLSGQGDTSIMVRFRSSFVSGAITVKSVSICNISSAVKSVTVYKRVAATPIAIQKEFTPTSIVATTNVSGLVSEVYRIKKVLYATSYNWYLNRGTNATITHINASGVNDTAVIVTFASCFVKDTLSVKSVTPCSISAAKTVIMSSSTTPTTVAGITTIGGDFAVCIGSSKTFTAIPSTPTTAQVGIARYRWTNPLNTVITSATSDSSSITVSFNTGFTGGSLTCKGISACGVVGTTATSSILQYLPPTPLSIASSTNSYNACINSSVTYTALVSAPTTAQLSASVFRWTRPNNTTITSATADSSSITVRFNSGYTGGVISVKGQSRCGTQSATRSQALTHTGCALGTKTSLPITTTNTPSFEVSLYPNPTASEFKLLIKNNAVVGSNKPSKAIIKVIDLQGRMMKSFTTNTNQVTAIGNELKAVVYMVEVRLGEEVKTIRAVKF